MIPEDRVSTHPGETLREEFLKPPELSPAELAARLRWPLQELDAVLAEAAPVTPALARALSREFGTSVGLWLNLQASHDLTRVRAHPRHGWATAFADMARRGDDALLDREVATEWDETQWEWQ